MRPCQATDFRNNVVKSVVCQTNVINATPIHSNHFVLRFACLPHPYPLHHRVCVSCTHVYLNCDQNSLKRLHNYTYNPIAMYFIKAIHSFIQKEEAFCQQAKCGWLWQGLTISDEMSKAIRQFSARHFLSIILLSVSIYYIINHLLFSFLFACVVRELYILI